MALVVGFLLAGMIASLYQWIADRPPSFGLLQQGGWQAVAAVPLVVAAAPWIILRNTLRGRRFERRPLIFVWLATVIAAAWSLASGRVFLDLVMSAGL